MPVYDDYDDTPDPFNRQRDARLRAESDAAVRRHDAEARSGAALASFMAQRLASRPRLSRSARSAPPEHAETFAAFVRGRLAAQRQWGAAKLRAMADAVRPDENEENPSR